MNDERPHNDAAFANALQQHVGARAPHLLTRLTGGAQTRTIPGLTTCLKQGPKLDMEAALLLERVRRTHPDAVDARPFIAAYFWRHGERVLATYGFAAGAELCALWLLLLPEGLACAVIIEPGAHESRILASPWDIAALHPRLDTITDPRDLSSAACAPISRDSASPEAVVAIATRLLLV